MNNKSNVLTKNAKHIPGLLFCSFWCLIIFVILAYVLAASFSTSRDIFSGTVFRYETGLHWENYVRAWSKQKLYLCFFNSLLYATVGTLGGTAIAAPSAYVLSRYKFRGNHLLRRTYITCLSIPGILILLPIYALILKWDIQGRAALMIMYACMRVPYTTIFLLNYFETISKTYEEAAAIDGCSPDGIFARIMLPMVAPAIGTICLFGFISILNEYMLCLLLVNSGPALNLGVGLQRTIKALTFMGDYPGIFAAILICVVPSIVLYAFSSRKIVFGGMTGGIKG